MATTTRTSVRWPQRRLAAAVVDVAALAIPVVLAIVTVMVVSHVLPSPRQATGEVFWWIAVAGSSAIVLIVTERQARRLLPLTSLLRLSMAFPDQAPSRFGIALRAGTVRDLEARLTHVHDHGVDDDLAP